MKLAKTFLCVPDGEIYPREIAAGEECPRELEPAAAELGLLEKLPQEPPAAAEPNAQKQPKA